MKYLITFIALLSLQFSLSAQDSDPVEILFVGNSYTYFWNLPQVIEAMAVSQNEKLVARQSTAGGANLGEHWRGEKNLKTDSIIRSNYWDYVVLQDHSMSTMSGPDSLSKYVYKWSDVIEEIGADPVLYMTWARAFNPLMINTISKGYEDVGNDQEVIVVPVGKAWSLARHLRPEIELYDADGSHPSALGTYLIASTFYKAFTGKSVDELPNRLISKDQNGEKLYLMIVSPTDAQFCQDVVESVYKDCKNCRIDKRGK